jgi:hypothetical protein
MARLWTGKFLSQDKGWPGLLRKHWPPLGNRAGSPSSTSQSFSLRLWLLVVVITAAVARLSARARSFGLNLSASVPRGAYAGLRSPSIDLQDVQRAARDGHAKSEMNPRGTVTSRSVCWSARLEPKRSREWLNSGRAGSAQKMPR